MEDYDYIGEGGIVIECNDGKYGIFPRQAEFLKQNSSYFRGCFCHDMVEQQTSTLQKPEWSVFIAEYVVKMLLNGVVHVRDLDLATELMEVADQVLVDLRLCDLEYGSLLSKEDGYNVISLMQQPKNITFQATISNGQWLKLLQMGILLKEYCKDDYMLRTFQDEDDPETLPQQTEPDEQKTYDVFSRDTSLSSIILAIRNVIRRDNTEPNDFNKETFKMKVAYERDTPATIWSPPGRANPEVKYDRVTDECDLPGYWISASPKMLLYFLRYTGMEHEDVVCKWFYVTHPTTRTLDRIFSCSCVSKLDYDLDRNYFEVLKEHRSCSSTLDVFESLSNCKCTLFRREIGEYRLELVLDPYDNREMSVKVVDIDFD